MHMEIIQTNTLRRALEDLHYLPLLPVQESVIPLFLKKKDLLVQAKTGSGKTAAYLIPLLEMSREYSPCTSLVIAPTRELALQIKEEADRLSSYMRIKSTLLIGGFSEQSQIRQLKAHPQIIIGTPGRIVYMIREKQLSLSSLERLVIDEADLIFSTGQSEELKVIQSYISQPVQTVCLSATISDTVRQYFPGNYETVIMNEIQVNEQIAAYHYLCEVKYRALLKVLRHLPVLSAIVYVNHRSDAERIALRLQKQNIPAEAFSGSFDEKTRIRIMRAFKAGMIRVLVSTDASARGIDVHDLSHIIHYDLPIDIETYIHRSGRSGHQGNTGTAVTLINEEDKESEITKYIVENSVPLIIDLDQPNDITKPLPKKEQPQTEVMRIRINAGKDDKIRPKDIAGALCTYLPFEQIGKIEIREHDTIVHILDPSFDHRKIARLSVKGKLRNSKVL